MNWYDNAGEYETATCNCPDHTGRELRLWTGLKNLDGISSNPESVHNAATTAAAFPFAFTANQGVVFADKIA